MVNEEALQKIRKLEEEYARKWDKEVDYCIMPRGMSQEEFVHVLERMLITNESMLVAYGNIKGRE